MTASGPTRRSFLTGSVRLAGLTGLVGAGGCGISPPDSAGAEPGGPAGGAPRDTSGGVLTRMRSRGEAVVAIAGVPPFAYTDASAGLTGASVEVAREVFRRLDVPRLTSVEVTFDSLFDALENGAVDIVTAGMLITPARCRGAAFSRPEYVLPTAFLVPAGNPAGIVSFADVAARRLAVAVLSFSTEEDQAAAAGVANRHILPIASPPGLLDAVVTGRAACAALDNISLNRVLAQNPTNAVAVTAGYFPGEIRAAGFATRAVDRDLREAFDAELGALLYSDEWLRIVQPFGFTADNRPPPDLLTQRLCSS